MSFPIVGLRPVFLGKKSVGHGCQLKTVSFGLFGLETHSLLNTV